MSVEIAWKQNILVTDFYLLKLLLVVFGFGLQAFVCENICSVLMAVGIFYLCSPSCPKQPRTSFPFYKFFYPTISAKISECKVGPNMLI